MLMWWRGLEWLHRHGDIEDLAVDTMDSANHCCDGADHLFL